MDEYAMSKLFDMASELVFCAIERASERGALWHLPRHVRIRSGRRRERIRSAPLHCRLTLTLRQPSDSHVQGGQSDQDPQAIKCS